MRGMKRFTPAAFSRDFIELRTLGDFTVLGRREQIFMMVTMCAFLVIGGYALSTLTGILSSDAVMALRENKTMEHSLDRLANHVIVIGFGGLGRLVAGRLRKARRARSRRPSSCRPGGPSLRSRVSRGPKATPGWTMPCSTTRGSSGPRRLW